LYKQFSDPDKYFSNQYSTDENSTQPVLLVVLNNTDQRSLRCYVLLFIYPKFE